MYCRKCGCKLEEGEKFCTNCGNQVVLLKPSKIQINKSNAGEYQKNHKRWSIKFGLLICIVFCVALAGGIYGVTHSGMTGKYRALVQDTSGKYGYIDQKCKEVIACQYDDARDFDECGLAAVAKETSNDGNKKWGIIDSAGKEIVPMVYDNISEYGFSDNGLISVAKTRHDGYEEIDEWGFVNQYGKEVIPCQYVSAMGDAFVWNKKGLVAVGQIAGIDNSGEYHFTYGVIDETGATVIPFEYSDISWILGESGVIAVQKYVGIDQYDLAEYSWGFVDMNNDVIIPFKYEGARSFADNGLALVVNKPDEEGETGKTGYINISGEAVIPCKYENYGCGDFLKNGLVVVRNLDGQAGYIDENEKVEIPFVYEYAFPFEADGNAIVSKITGKDEEGYDITQYGLIDEHGEEVLSCEYDWISRSNTGGYRYVERCINDNYKYGVVNERGKFITTIEYELVGIGKCKLTPNGYACLYSNCDLILLGKETGYHNKRIEYRCSYVDGKGKLVLQLPEQYINAGVFMKIS